MNPTLAALIAQLAILAADDAIFSNEIAHASQVKDLRQAVTELKTLADAANDEHSAAELLVLAYAKSDSSGSSINWEEVDTAVERAREELGEERCEQLQSLVADEA